MRGSMQHSTWRLTPSMVLLAGVVLPAVTTGTASSQTQTRAAAFVCSKGDGTEDVVSGMCAKCGVELVPANRELKAAILVFNGVQIIDYCGPYEVFGQGRCETFTVARTTDPITTAMGMKVVPARSFADCPPVDILVLPGGGVDGVENDPEAIRWLRERGERAQFVLSVCNGAFILAKTGLLDGLTATTFYDLIDEFEERYPKVTAVRDRRYVDNGKFVTTAGISSGIDGSLHVIEKLRGRGMAQRVALNMEYDWKPDADYARAAFADRHVRRVFDRNLRLEILEGVAPLVVSTRGDRDRWQVEWRVASDVAAPQLLERLDRALEERGKWERTGSGGDPARSAWRFEERGVRWTGVSEVAAEGAKDRYTVRVTVARAVP